MNSMYTGTILQVAASIKVIKVGAELCKTRDGYICVDGSIPGDRRLDTLPHNAGDYYVDAATLHKKDYLIKKKMKK